MAECRDFFYPSADGRTQIHARCWQPEGAPRAVVQIAHGICEHIGRYDAFARWLAERGFLVVANDHPGHGQSWQEPERKGLFAETGGWQLAVGEMEALRRRTAETWPDVPYFLLGHSMGSFLTRTYLILHPGALDGAILSGTGQQGAALLAAGYGVAALMCRVKGAKHRSELLRTMMFGGYNNAFRPNRTQYDWLCGNGEAVDAYCADPLCGFLPCVGLYRDMLGGLRFIGKAENAVKMDKTTPVLFLSGTMDPVGEQGKGVDRAVALFRQAGCGDVTDKRYPGGRHEVLNEIWREDVYCDVLEWLEERVKEH